MREEDLFIKGGYQSRAEAQYFDSRPHSPHQTVHQPEAYAFAAYLASRYQAEAIVDIGCGAGGKLAAIQGFRKVGVDFGANLEFCQKTYPDDTWIVADLETACRLEIDDTLLRRSVIICADVIEHLVDPRSLIKLLAALSRVAHAVIITTPERDLVRGFDHFGPPPNPAHVREWNLAEFVKLLTAFDLVPAFAGLTVNNNVDLQKRTIVAICDRNGMSPADVPPIDFRPLAIVAAFNDREIISETISRMVDDGIDVHVLDNWSDDGTFELLLDLKDRYPGLTIERYPADKSLGFNWAATLEEKAKIAALYPGRWIIHHDSDEIRCSPWMDVSLRTALWSIDRSDFNAIDFTVLDFRPTDARFVEGCRLEKTLSYFEFGRRPGHFLQVKAWKQPYDKVLLAEAAGHDVGFGGRRVFPYKFILKHYPLRSPELARKKVFRERKARYAPDLRTRGWHTQYDRYAPGDEFIWFPGDLIEFCEPDVYRDYLIELISGVGISR